MSQFASLPRWVPQLIATLVIMILVLVLIGLAMFMPHVSRLADAGAALPQAVEIVESAPTTLDQVERIDANVETVVPPVLEAVEEIPLLTPLLQRLLNLGDDLQGDLGQLNETAGPLSASAAELAALGTQLSSFEAELVALQTQLAALEGLTDPLDDLAAAAAPLPAELRSLNESAAAIATLPALLTGLIDAIGRVERHVANLDQKTGPVLLPSFGAP